LREKEKLKHEHYKLKERIEQLRNMDYSAFLGLPDDLFADNEVNGTALVEEAVDAQSHSSANLEGERRRRKMLEAAKIIEERYRVLLPSDKKSMEKMPGKRGPIPISEELASAFEPLEDSTLNESLIVADETIASQSKSLKFIIKIPSRQPSVTASVSSMAVSNLSARADRELDGDVIPRRRGPSRKRQTVPPPTEVSLEVANEAIDVAHRASEAPLPNGVDTDVAVQEDVVGEQHVSSQEVEPPAPSPSPAPRKRMRPSSREDLHHGDSISAHGDPHTTSADDSFEVVLSAEDIESFFGPTPPWTRRPLPAIIVEARRNSDTPDARKTARHTLAFGVKLPAALAETRDFELPEWFWAQHDEANVTGEDETPELEVNVNGLLDGHGHLQDNHVIRDHIDEDKMDEEHILQPRPALAGGIHDLQVTESNDVHPSPASLSDAQALLGLSQVRLRQPANSTP
jgi:hypothetical protein